MPFDNVMVLTEQPVVSEPQRATIVLSTRTGVVEAPLGGVSSTLFVDLGNSSSSMLSLPSFHARIRSNINTKLEVMYI